jgi:hypothetical protein
MFELFGKIERFEKSRDRNWKKYRNIAAWNLFLFSTTAGHSSDLFWLFAGAIVVWTFLRLESTLGDYGKEAKQFLGWVILAWLQTLFFNVILLYVIYTGILLFLYYPLFSGKTEKNEHSQVYSGNKDRKRLGEVCRDYDGCKEKPPKFYKSK